MLKVHCVGVLLWFGVLLLVWLDMHAFGRGRIRLPFLKTKKRRGRGHFVARAFYLQNTGAEVRSRGGCNMYGSSGLDAPALSCDCCCYLFPFHVHLPA